MPQTSVFRLNLLRCGYLLLAALVHAPARCIDRRDGVRLLNRHRLPVRRSMVLRLEHLPGQTGRRLAGRHRKPDVGPVHVIWAKAGCRLSNSPNQVGGLPPKRVRL